MTRETQLPAAARDGFVTYDELRGPDLDAARWSPARLPLPTGSEHIPVDPNAELAVGEGEVRVTIPRFSLPYSRGARASWSPARAGSARQAFVTLCSAASDAAGSTQWRMGWVPAAGVADPSARICLNRRGPCRPRHAPLFCWRGSSRPSGQPAADSSQQRRKKPNMKFRLRTRSSPPAARRRPSSSAT